MAPVTKRFLMRITLGFIAGCLVTLAAITIGLPVFVGWGAALLLGLWIGYG